MDCGFIGIAEAVSYFTYRDCAAFLNIEEEELASPAVKWLETHKCATLMRLLFLQRVIKPSWVRGGST